MAAQLDFLEELWDSQGTGQDSLTPEQDLPFNQLDYKISEVQEDQLMKEAFTQGVDLRQYAHQVDRDLIETQANHVLDYASQTNAFVQIHSHIEAYDQTLSQMSRMLTGYQDTLGKISREIQLLQDQSQSQSLKLKNRQIMQQQLNEVLEGMTISPDLIKKICQGEVNDFFLLHLAELNKKMTYVKAHQGKQIRAFKDIGPELERLRQKAAEKSRDFLLKKIESLRSIQTNISMIQQNVLLKYKDLYGFLTERHSEVAQEIRSNYILLASSYYLSLFDKYIKGVSKLQTQIADKLDLIGCEEGIRKPTLFATRVAPIKDRANVFTLGDRIQLLTDPDPGIIIPQAAEDKGLRFTYEATFKSVCRLLMDNSSSEYIFSLEFFTNVNRSKKTPEIPGSAFTETFDPTLKVLQAFVKSYVDVTFDAVGILLCIRLNTQHIKIMQKRRIPCLEGFMNVTNMLLWPKFQTIMDLQVESLKTAIPSRLLPSRDVKPHYITRRYAELAASVLTLNQGYEDALLTSSLIRLRTEFENLMTRMSQEFSDVQERLVFLVNNYDLVVTILSEHTAPCFEEEKEHFNEILNRSVATFVEAELAPQFGLLMNFVMRVEGDKNALNIAADRYEKIATDFNANWKTAISALNASILKSFPNFQTGTRILHHALTDLILFYRRFLDLWEKRFGGQGQQRPRTVPVGIQTVIVEIKKFKSNFQ